MLRSRPHDQATPRHERGHYPPSSVRSTRRCPANPAAAWLSHSPCVVVVAVSLLLVVMARFTFELLAVAIAFDNYLFAARYTVCHKTVHRGHTKLFMFFLSINFVNPATNSYHRILVPYPLLCTRSPDLPVTTFSGIDAHSLGDAFPSPQQQQVTSPAAAAVSSTRYQEPVRIFGSGVGDSFYQF